MDSSQFISLADIIDRPLLDHYLDEVCGLGCAIYTPKSKLVHEVGDRSALGAIPESALKEVFTSPLPVDVPGGRVAGLFAKGELVGYAAVATRREEDAPLADFAFQLINLSIQQQLEKEGLIFHAEYLKNLISLMQGMSQRTTEVFDRRKVASLFILECEKLFGVRSGAVLTTTGGKIEILASFGGKFDDFPLIDHVLDTGKGFVCNSTLNEPLYKGRARPNNVMLVPLVSGQALVGFMYLRDRQTGPFGVEDQRMAQTVGAVLGSTIANIALHEDLVNIEREKATLSRYLSPNLLKEVAEGKFSTLGGRRMRTAVLFADIRGFTKIAENLLPERLVSQLNEYFEEMSKIIFDHDGTLDKFVGDMIMVIFGAPKPMPDASARALRTAIAMQARLKDLNRKWREEGKQAFEVGIGINTGDVVFGNIGSSKAMGLTVIGDNVNQAQRLQAYAGGGEILVSEGVAREMEHTEFRLARIGQIEVKHKKIVAYRLEHGKPEHG